jgi:hypothetical protein
MRWKLFWTERSDSESAVDATSDDYCRNEMDATDSCYSWKEQDDVGYGNKFFAHSAQMEKHCDKITWGYWPR